MNGAAAGFTPAGTGGGYPGGGGGGGGGATVEEMGGLAAGWMEMGRGMDDGFPVTALAFDPVEELLWVRWSCGFGVWVGGEVSLVVQ